MQCRQQYQIIIIKSDDWKRFLLEPVRCRESQLFISFLFFFFSHINYHYYYSYLLAYSAFLAATCEQKKNEAKKEKWNQECHIVRKAMYVLIYVGKINFLKCVWRVAKCPFLSWALIFLFFFVAKTICHLFARHHCQASFHATTNINDRTKLYRKIIRLNDSEMHARARHATGLRSRLATLAIITVLLCALWNSLSSGPFSIHSFARIQVLKLWTYLK